MWYQGPWRVQEEGLVRVPEEGVPWRVQEEGLVRVWEEGVPWRVRRRVHVVAAGVLMRVQAGSIPGAVAVERM